METFDKEKYLNDIKVLDNLNLYQYKDVDKMYGVYQNKLIELIDKNASYITLSKEKKKKKIKAKVETVDNFKYSKIYQNEKFVLQKIPQDTKNVFV